MSIILLGSSGSIGTQTLDVARRHNIKVNGLAVNSSVKLLEQQVREFKPRYVCVFDESYYNDIKTRLADLEVEFFCGEEGLCELAAQDCTTVVNAVVGMTGLEPTLAAINAGRRIALANKETIVAGGELVMKRAKEKNAQIIPVDSEHSAIFQCLAGNTNNKLSRIILTASGGAFYGYDKEKLKSVTKAQALKNPNWDMGAKVTIDSATLMNKGLEFIEAMRLFEVRAEEIEVVIHRQSIIHSAVEFADNSIIAQLSLPDMRIPIQYALTYPERLSCDAKKLSLTEIGSLTFEKPDEDNFPCLAAAKEAAITGNNACAVLNAANEAAVDAFLNDRISFYEIADLVTGALENIKANEEVSLQTIYEDSAKAKEYVRRETERQ